MRPYLCLAAALLMSAWVGAQPPTPSAPICLRATDIDSTSISDNHTIIFRMNNGARWKNVLQAECPGLRVAGGFDYAIRGGEVCANEQPIRVRGMPATCFLGPFTRMDAK